MSDQEHRDLIAYRLEEAGEALRDAEFLLDAGRYRSAANRLYYAAFYVVIAALLTRRLEYSRHSAAIAFFDKEFIRTGILPKEYSRTLHRALSACTSGKQSDPRRLFAGYSNCSGPSLSLDRGS